MKPSTSPSLNGARVPDTTGRNGFHKRHAVIIGAGPAGLTAAFELLERTDIVPIVLEKTDAIGGIARTVNYKGNRIDIGGHRFFSKSDRVMDWWTHILPVEATQDESLSITYQAQSRDLKTAQTGPDPEEQDLVMLVRQRKSRIYFLRKFFDYPISLSATTLRNLGITRSFKIGMSYLRSALFPIRNEQNLEEFFVNRFGRELYKTFFESYTEKVWGLPCKSISAEWGAQRVKGLNIVKAVTHAVRSIFRKTTGIAQKELETSLIERFLYPKHGPGQLWEEVARQVADRGGKVLLHQDVVGIHHDNGCIQSVTTRDATTGEEQTFSGEYFFSTMPIQDLLRSMHPPVDGRLREIGDGLIYRDFITVGLLVDKLKVEDPARDGKRMIKDNWIYIQEPDVLVGRLQIFNNWSPYMVADAKKVWLGLEYFCNEGDDLWTKSDEDLKSLARHELDKIGIIDASAVTDATVIRMPKTYPAYFGTYDRLDEVRAELDAIPNLFLVGRNGMHKYNNQDHSMLTAMTAVDNIIEGRTDKSNIWAVNTEQEYHEEKSSDSPSDIRASSSDPAAHQTKAAAASS